MHRVCWLLIGDQFVLSLSRCTKLPWCDGPLQRFPSHHSRLPLRSPSFTPQGRSAVICLPDVCGRYAGIVVSLTIGVSTLHSMSSPLHVMTWQSCYLPRFAPPLPLAWCPAEPPHPRSLGHRFLGRLPRSRGAFRWRPGPSAGAPKPRFSAPLRAPPRTCLRGSKK